MPFQVSQRQVRDMLGDMSIDIPRHQRPYVWDAKRGSAFIDTVMKNLPTHAIFLYQSVVNGQIKRDIEDGHQRYMTLKYFATGDLSGENIKWNGKRFNDFTSEEQARFMNYMLTVNTMENIVHEERIMLFQRLQEGKPLTSGQRFAALIDKPLVRLAQSIVENEQCHSVWGYHRETKTQTVLSNAIAIAAGLCLPNDNHITSSYEIVGPEIFANPEINESLAAQRLNQLLEVYRLADLTYPTITTVEKKKQWKVGEYTGYILYTMRQPDRDWERDKHMWVDYIVRVRREPSTGVILHYNKPSSRNWNRERWMQGLYNLEHQEEVLQQLNGMSSIDSSDED